MSERKTRWVRSGEWVGGYRRRRADVATGRAFGPEVFVIERWVDGRRFHVSTRATTEAAAVRQLARFEADPGAYTPAGSLEAKPELTITAKLAAEYHAHQIERGLTAEWADSMQRALARWAEAIGHLDLRRVRLQELRAALERWPKAKALHIKALRGFCRWLRVERGLMTHSEDATLDLPVPQARPEKWRRRKVVAPEDVQALLRVLPAPFADVLHLQTATAWHLSEVARFAENGEIVRAAGPVLAVLMTRHKSGELTRTPLLHQEHLEAAERLQAWARLHRWPTRTAFSRVLRRCCAEAGVPHFGLGVMRHSVLTWAHEAGTTMASLAEFAQHRSEQTTRRFYVDAAVPVGSIPVRRFQR